ncbi:hypothetical protein BAC3_02063 [uncultured bacterium]|nr:hypothetical protein BAC3_02063 [uncultured bacterium]
MRLKNRYALFVRMMAVLTMVLSVSVMSCCQRQKGGGNGGEASGTVWGVVTNASNGNPISGASMKLYNASKTYGPYNRNPQGGYSITATAAAYTLRAAASGYGTQTRSVTLDPNETEQQNFQLQPQ